MTSDRCFESFQPMIEIPLDESSINSPQSTSPPQSPQEGSVGSVSTLAQSPAQDAFAHEFEPMNQHKLLHLAPTMKGPTPTATASKYDEQRILLNLIKAHMIPLPRQRVSIQLDVLNWYRENAKVKIVHNAKTMLCKQ